MEKTELKSCPFCGSNDVLLKEQNLIRSFVTCNNCGCESAMLPESEAIAAWNRRSDENRLKAEAIKELQDAFWGMSSVWTDNEISDFIDDYLVRQQATRLRAGQEDNNADQG